ncbi:hypothetical protein NE237_002541 [Protea cynaroides]|uniref:Uncharacterized protein n=1 Tax=Protea cynaroides TaxID=273540 RepID=A0A9Q0KVD8_9MAGN|nr:hypothetical protein NE237_002541 [Protea cynaroides]
MAPSLSATNSFNCDMTHTTVEPPHTTLNLHRDMGTVKKETSSSGGLHTPFHGNNPAKRQDLRLLLGVLGCPLAPVPLHDDPIHHLPMKDIPIECGLLSSLSPAIRSSPEVMGRLFDIIHHGFELMLLRVLNAHCVGSFRPSVVFIFSSKEMVLCKSSSSLAGKLVVFG